MRGITAKPMEILPISFRHLRILELYRYFPLPAHGRGEGIAAQAAVMLLLPA